MWSGNIFTAEYDWFVTSHLAVHFESTQYDKCNSFLEMSLHTNRDRVDRQRMLVLLGVLLGAICIIIEPMF